MLESALSHRRLRDPQNIESAPPFFEVLSQAPISTIHVLRGQMHPIKVLLPAGKTGVERPFSKPVGLGRDQISSADSGAVSQRKPEEIVGCAQAAGDLRLARSKDLRPGQAGLM